MAHWENQALRAPRVKEVTQDKKESQDSLAKLAALGREALLGRKVNQVSQAVPGRGDPMVNQDPKDLLERLDLMESKDLKVGLVRRGNRVPSESQGQRGMLGCWELKGSRDRRE